jgi:hypothetical protein
MKPPDKHVEPLADEEASDVIELDGTWKKRLHPGGPAALNDSIVALA